MRSREGFLTTGFPSGNHPLPAKRFTRLDARITVRTAEAGALAEFGVTATGAAGGSDASP